MRGEYHTAIEHGKMLFELAEDRSDLAPTIIAHRAIGSGLLMLGQLESSRHHLEKALAHFDPEHHNGLAEQYGFDFGVTCYGWISTVFLLTGMSNRESELFSKCEYYAEVSGDINSICHMHGIGWTNAAIKDDLAGWERHTAMQSRIAQEHKHPWWVSYSTMSAGLLLIASGDISGLEMFKQGADALTSSAQLFLLPTMQVIAARHLFAMGDFEHTNEMINNAQALVEKTEEKMALSDLLRLKAAIAQMDNHNDIAEQQLRESLEVAQQRGAKLYEIRAAIDYAQLKMSQGMYEQAQEVLQPAYNGIVEGNCPKEKVKAKQLLDNMSA